MKIRISTWLLLITSWPIRAGAILLCKYGEVGGGGGAQWGYRNREAWIKTNRRATPFFTQDAITPLHLHVEKLFAIINVKNLCMHITFKIFRLSR